MSEIIADYKPHVAGEREVVNWTRPDGSWHPNVPVMYLREVTAEDYFEKFPHWRGRIEAERCHFWEVSVD